MASGDASTRNTHHDVGGDRPTTASRTKVVDNRHFGGTWTWDLESAYETECHLTITEDGEIYNPVFRFIARFFMDYRATIDSYHAALASRFGESTNDFFQNLDAG